MVYGAIPFLGSGCGDSLEGTVPAKTLGLNKWGQYQEQQGVEFDQSVSLPF